jgi:hypothetical protein
MRPVMTATAVSSARRRPRLGAGGVVIAGIVGGPGGAGGAGGHVGTGSVGWPNVPTGRGSVVVPPRGAYHWGVGFWSVMANAPSTGVTGLHPVNPADLRAL